jgi:histidinol-phosphate phosphatase family protein
MTAKRWGVFLDRDGTLVPDTGHMVRPDQLGLYAEAGAALRELKKAGATLIVVSNQSAVARGLMDTKGLERMDRRLRRLARSEGAPLDATYYCPHHPDFSGSCECRKPATGMIDDGLRDFGLASTDCFLVGDTLLDMEAGRRAGVTTVLVLTGMGKRIRGDAEDRGLVDGVVRHIGAAAKWILGNR